LNAILIRDAEMFLKRWGTTRKPQWVLWLRLIFLTPGFQFIFWLRMQRAVSSIPIAGPVLRRVLWCWTRIWFSSEVDTQAAIGAGFYMPHPHGIVIGAGVSIGENVSVLQRVTLGRAGDNHVYPVIGNGVEIGTGAAVLGAIRVGDGAKIGANSVVLKDVPPGAVAVGAPARLIQRQTGKE
jgi:serine O-acetyltransferase